jgi:hypothetical protein
VSVLLSNGALVVSASGDSSSASGIDADPRAGDARESGAFYLFGEEQGEWKLSHFVKSSNARSGSLFADRAAISGETIVVSAMHDSASDTTDSGRVYIFR